MWNKPVWEKTHEHASKQRQTGKDGNLELKSLSPWVKCSLFLPYLHHVPLEPGAAFCSLQHSKYKIRSESACMCSLMKSLNSFLSRKMCLLSRPPDKFHSPWAHSSLRHSFAVLLTVKHISCKSANFRVGQISSEWKQCLLVLCLHTDLPAISGLAVLEAPVT